MFLALHNVSFKYDNDSQILYNVSYSFANPGLYFIAEDRPCGKTTLINLLGLVLMPTTGSVFCMSKNLSSLRDEQQCIFRRNIGIYNDKFSFIENATVFDNLMAQLAGDDKINQNTCRNKILDILQCFNITETRERRICDLSASQRAKIGIAKSIIHRPKVVLLDNPTINMSQSDETAFIDMLYNFANSAPRRQSVVIIATNRQALTKIAPSTILRIEDKKLVEESSRAQLHQ